MLFAIFTLIKNTCRRRTGRYEIVFSIINNKLTSLNGQVKIAETTGDSKGTRI